MVYGSSPISIICTPSINYILGMTSVWFPLDKYTLYSYFSCILLNASKIVLKGLLKLPVGYIEFEFISTNKSFYPLIEIANNSNICMNFISRIKLKIFIFI